MKNIFIMLLSLLSIKITAQIINYNTEFQVNTFTENKQNAPSICGIPDGGFVAVWESYGKDNSGYGIYGQAYNSDMSLKGEEFRVNSFTSNDQQNPSISTLSDGGFIVVWESALQDGSGWGIFAQAFKPDFTLRGEEFQVNTYAGATQWRPSVCSLVDGRVIIVWHSRGDFNTGHDVILGQAFNLDLRKIKAEFRVNTNLGGEKTQPSIVSLDNGGFVVVWENSYQDIYGQVFNSDLTKRDEEFRVNTHSGTFKYNPSVTNIRESEFVVAWQSKYQDGSVYGIYGQAFKSNLSKRGEEFQINTHTPYSQTNPVICKLDNEKFFVAWQWSNYSDLSSNGIFGQVFNYDVTPFGEEFKINNSVAKLQESPAVCSFGNGKFAVAWKGDEILGKYYLNEPIVHELRNFNINNPIYDETITELNPKFEWEKSSDVNVNYPWELKYNLYLSEDIEFTTPQIIAGITNLEYRVDPLEANQTYFWKVLAKNYDGDSLWSSNVNGFFIDPGATVGINENKLDLPEGFSLSQNYPNPFNPSTVVRYDLPHSEAGIGDTRFVSLKVYDVLGKEVATLVNKEQSAGSYEVEFNASASSATTKGLSSGVYFYRLKAGRFIETKKMLLLR